MSTGPIIHRGSRLTQAGLRGRGLAERPMGMGTPVHGEAVGVAGSTWHTPPSGGKEGRGLGPVPTGGTLRVVAPWDLGPASTASLLALALGCVVIGPGHLCAECPPRRRPLFITPLAQVPKRSGPRGVRQEAGGAPAPPHPAPQRVPPSCCHRWREYGVQVASRAQSICVHRRPFQRRGWGTWGGRLVTPWPSAWVSREKRQHRPPGLRCAGSLRASSVGTAEPSSRLPAPGSRLPAPGSQLTATPGAGRGTRRLAWPWSREGLPRAQSGLSLDPSGRRTRPGDAPGGSGKASPRAAQGRRPASMGAGPGGPATKPSTATRAPARRRRVSGVSRGQLGSVGSARVSWGQRGQPGLGPVSPCRTQTAQLQGQWG